MMVNLPCLMESGSNFLRPTCSYTKCRLSFQPGSCPTEGTPVSYSSCFYLILTDLQSHMEICLYSGRVLPCSRLLVLLLMQCLSLLHRYRVAFQNPAGIQSRRIPAMLWNYVAVWLLCCLFHLLCRSFYVWQKLLRIIGHSLCQYRINYP